VNAAEVVVGEVQAVGRPKVSHFFERAFVNRVKRRICILIVKFWRSTWLVQIFAGSGLPMTGTRSVCVTSGGLYRRWPSGSLTYTLISCAKSQRSEGVVVIADL
jgi:hypothetical protein